MSCNEFDIISRYFKREKPVRKDVHLGIGDDCAVLNLDEKKQLAISTDTLVSGIHFLPDIDPADLGYKSLAVNLSDLASMGADPAWVSLALTLPEVNEPWLKRFSDSLFERLEYYGMQLIGGDTTKGPLSMTLTVHGWVPAGKALTRYGAKNGDWIYVTGYLGDSAAGLAILQNRFKVADSNQRDYLLQRHLRPQPRLLTGQGLRDLASAAIDISDGVISDLQHILKASQCGAVIDVSKLPFSPALMAQAEAQQRNAWALAGGEDYELCFTVPEENKGALDVLFNRLGVHFTCIGQINGQAGQLTLKLGEETFTPSLKGFDHFGAV